MSTLECLDKGERAEVLSVSPAEELRNHRCSLEGECKCKQGFYCHLNDVSIDVGETVEMLGNEGESLLLVKAGGSLVAMSRDLAMRIVVGRKGD